jgi:hypothetical protein
MFGPPHCAQLLQPNRAIGQKENEITDTNGTFSEKPAITNTAVAPVHGAASAEPSVRWTPAALTAGRDWVFRMSSPSGLGSHLGDTGANRHAARVGAAVAAAAGPW